MTDFTEKARRLRNAVEPVAAGVYFAPEAHAAYEALGFDGSPASAGRRRPPGAEVVLHQPRRVHGPGAGRGRGGRVRVLQPQGRGAGGRRWLADRRPRRDPRRPRAGRDRDAAAGPRRAARRPRPGHRAAPPRPPTPRRGPAAASTEGCARSASPTDPMGAMWRAADLVREHRGDSHVISWAVGGADAVEILLLTEQWWGLPPAPTPRPVAGRAPTWTPASSGSQRRGLMTDDEQLTDAGRAFREEIEVRTDELERPVLDALGDDLDELLEHLDAWSEAIIDAGSYPQRIAGVYNVGGGPHFGSGLTIDTAAEQYDIKA